MTPSEARKILELLADGVDPETGEVLPGSSPYNSPMVIRALFAALNALNATPGQERRNPDLPPNSGKAWSAAEDSEMLALFDAGVQVKEIAAKHSRTPGSIASRLVRLGRIKERSEVWVRNRESSADQNTGTSN